MNAVLQGPAAVTPALRVPDPEAAYWLSQVNLRLRREVSWCWHLRAGRPDPLDGSLPPTTDSCAENLDWVRYLDQKHSFLANDPAGKYLSEYLNKLPRPSQNDGYWERMTRDLELDEVSQFVLALALAQRLDSGLAPVFATCMNDLSRPYATLALAQRLWDDPISLATIIDQRLTRYGLLRRSASHEDQPDWQQPLDMPATVAAVLAGLSEATQTAGLERLPKAAAHSKTEWKLLGWRLAQRHPTMLEIIPLHGPAGADFETCVAILSDESKRPVLKAPAQLATNPDNLMEYLTLAWLAGADLMLPEDLPQDEKQLNAVLLRSIGIPVRCFMPIQDRQTLQGLPGNILLPEVPVAGTDYAERLKLLLEGLGDTGERLRNTLEDCARRFRLQAPALQRLTENLRAYPSLDADTLIEACRLEAQADMGHLAQHVSPRFKSDELILPAAQDQQFDEVQRAMRSLTRVHYQWGTAKAWNESGLAVLFCGPPGTGKTMAAEVLANVLDLDLYRIDLSQVVNKYIGETEKNLKRIFDAAETSDCILFFDEADALFGKRTDVKDAHDRFANIEISYLLERMERFKGLAILATNRRKDLDEAFLRRLRYIIEFPVPGPMERERIWHASFPGAVDTTDIDFRFLAKQFSLSGGHIRSIIFNACLQAAQRESNSPLPAGKVGRVAMTEVLVQVKRELQKINRATGDEQFGDYAQQMTEWLS